MSLFKKLPRSQKVWLSLLEKLSKKKNWSDPFFSIIMYKSPATIMKGCTKVKPHEWRCDVKLVRHVEGRKEEKGEEI